VDGANPAISWAAECCCAGLKREDIVVHGFRSSFRDWAAERTHFLRNVREAAPAHVIKDLYARPVRQPALVAM
jgi:hypothetical protein